MSMLVEQCMTQRYGMDALNGLNGGWVERVWGGGRGGHLGNVMADIVNQVHVQIHLQRSNLVTIISRCTIQCVTG